MLPDNKNFIGNRLRFDSHIFISEDLAMKVIFPAREIKDGQPLENSAVEFCKRYLRDKFGLKEDGIMSGDFTPGDTFFPLPDEKSALLVITDSMLIVSPATISGMMKTLQQGYIAVAPALGETRFLEQKAGFPWNPWDISTFEELNEEMLSEPVHQIIQTERLDPACILFDRCCPAGIITDVLQGRFPEEFPPGKIRKLAIFRNSLAFSFQNSEKHQREEIVRLISPETKSLLDVGCSYGALGKRLQVLYPEMVLHGVEVNPGAAKAAARYYSEMHVSGIEDFTPAFHFDCVVCADVIEHLENPWKQLSRIYHFLEKGGCLVVSTPNIGHWSVVAQLAKGMFTYLSHGIVSSGHLRWFTRETITDALETAGFIIEVLIENQAEPSPQGLKLTEILVKNGFGERSSLMTHGILIKAVKK